MGKQTAVLKTLVTDEVSDDFTKFARQHGYSGTSDCLRELVPVAVYGPDHLASVCAPRIAALARPVADSGTAGASVVPVRRA